MRTFCGTLAAATIAPLLTVSTLIPALVAAFLFVVFTAGAVWADTWTSGFLRFWYWYWYPDRANNKFQGLLPLLKGAKERWIEGPADLIAPFTRIVWELETLDVWPMALRGERGPSYIQPEQDFLLRCMCYVPSSGTTWTGLLTARVRFPQKGSTDDQRNFEHVLLEYHYDVLYEKEQDN